MTRRCTVRSAVLKGIEAIPVAVEVVVSKGVPAFNIVGMADAAVMESRERVRAALKQSDLSMPVDRVTVNLAPSSLKKSGSGFDLPIALGILAATGQIPPELVKNRLFVGELSLDGHIRSVAGMLAYALLARDQGITLVCASDAEGLIPVQGLHTEGLGSLRDLTEKGFGPLMIRKGSTDQDPLDLADVAGNEVAKRALQIAAAGDHGLLMMGPPGSGKTMLASRLPSILPPLEPDEVLECALIHSVASKDISSILAGTRPFRSPHHSATAPSLVGGGHPVLPGEVSLAHNGVLFLDELAEFKPSVLQQMRQPLESGSITIARAEGVLTFPSRFMLIAASNPCPCGYFGDPDQRCTCREDQVRAYQNRIGGPLMDRIDMHIDVRRVDPGVVIEGRRGQSSQELRDGVMVARDYRSWREAHDPQDEGGNSVVASCHLSSDDEAFFEETAQRNAMSGRAIVRTLSVARTIADMDERPKVDRSDLCEALSFRIRTS